MLRQGQHPFPSRHAHSLDLAQRRCKPVGDPFAQVIVLRVLAAGAHRQDGNRDGDGNRRGWRREPPGQRRTQHQAQRQQPDHDGRLNRERNLPLPDPTAFHRFALLEQREIAGHFFRRPIALARIRLAPLDDHRVQFQKGFFPGLRSESGGESGKITSILAGRGLIEDFAESVQVGLWSARTFGWNEPFRPHKRPGIAQVGHQPDVRQLRHTPDKDDVRGFDVAMHQPVLMQMCQRPCQTQPEPDTLRRRQAAPGFQLRAQSAGSIRSRVAQLGIGDWGLGILD